ncbi:MAG: hypothetical protein WC325_08400 [Candidatus Bathyarchaeia archaeon]|jgi:hypothetical protein
MASQEALDLIEYNKRAIEAKRTFNLDKARLLVQNSLNVQRENRMEIERRFMEDRLNQKSAVNDQPQQKEHVSNRTRHHRRLQA